MPSEDELLGGDYLPSDYPLLLSASSTSSTLPPLAVLMTGGGVSMTKSNSCMSSTSTSSHSTNLTTDDATLVMTSSSSRCRWSNDQAGGAGGGGREGHRVTFAEDRNEYVNISTEPMTSRSHGVMTSQSRTCTTGDDYEDENDVDGQMRRSSSATRPSIIKESRCVRSGDMENRDNPFSSDGELRRKADYILQYSTISRARIRIADPDLLPTPSPTSVDPSPSSLPHEQVCSRENRVGNEYPRGESGKYFRQENNENPVITDSFMMTLRHDVMTQLERDGMNSSYSDATDVRLPDLMTLSSQCHDVTTHDRSVMTRPQRHEVTTSSDRRHKTTSDDDAVNNNDPRQYDDVILNCDSMTPVMRCHDDVTMSEYVTTSVDISLDDSTTQRLLHRSGDDVDDHVINDVASGEHLRDCEEGGKAGGGGDMKKRRGEEKGGRTRRNRRCVCCIVQ